MVKPIALCQIATSQNYFQLPVKPNCSFLQNGCNLQRFPKLVIATVKHYCYLQSHPSNIRAIINFYKKQE